MLWLLFTALFHSATKALELESRIVNGIPIQASTYPWMVSLRSVSKYQAYTWRGDTNTSSIEFCGGSLINLSPPIVLTAAQCVNWFEYNATEGQFVETYDNVNKTYPIYLYADINRTHAMDETGEPYQSLQITDESMVHIHEKYNASTLQNGYDIALIVFDDGQTVSGFSESDIPSLGESLGDDEECCTDGDELDVLGYGANVTGWSAGYYSNPLQRTKTLEYTTVRYVEMSECKSIIGDYHDALFYYYHAIYSTEFAHDGFVCAVGNNTDFCWSDYGGPLFNESDGEIQILGLYSLSVRCSMYNIIHHLPLNDVRNCCI